MKEKDFLGHKFLALSPPNGFTDFFAVKLSVVDCNGWVVYEFLTKFYRELNATVLSTKSTV
jgi:hypothetical protein